MYIRKTKDVYHVMGNYGHGWECKCSEYTFKEAKQRLKEYRGERRRVLSFRKA